MVVADIGVAVPATGVSVAEESDVARWWPVPGPNSQKYTRGVVGLVLATIFRFLAYRYFVFNEELGEKLQPVPSGSGPALVGAGQR